ncbi:MAG: hypothetical protein HOE90_08155 [Bacteriovoracaceae bacterium]|nr:hypothetical protein [Bacteriovoracaceae bacterium]
MDVFLTEYLGKNGIVGLVGLLFFIVVYKYSVPLFNWIEDQTYGTRDYILQRLELMHIDIAPERITYLLLFLTFGLGTILLLLFTFLGEWKLGLFLAVLISVVGWKIPKPFVNYLFDRRVKEYHMQMVDALNLLSNGIRAGLSVPQALGMVVDEMKPPLSQEFALILKQNNIGVTLDEAFENLNKRIPLSDNEMFVTSVNILRETGGNLAETFDTIVDVIRERVRVQQKIEALIAQGKTQAYTLACMPIIVLGMSYQMDPDSVSLMFSTWPGRIALFVAAVIDMVGLYVVTKIIKIKV